MISDALFRIQVQRSENVDSVGRAFEVQQTSITKTLERSAISKASQSLFLGSNTIFKHSSLRDAQTSALQFLKSISDYLERGPNSWYIIHDEAIEFRDGDEEPDGKEEGPVKKSFR